MTYRHQCLSQLTNSCCWECNAHAMYVGRPNMIRQSVPNAVCMVTPYALALSTSKAMPFAVDACMESLLTTQQSKMQTSDVNGNLLYLPRLRLGRIELVMLLGLLPHSALPSEEQLPQSLEQLLLLPKGLCKECQVRHHAVVRQLSCHHQNLLLPKPEPSVELGNPTRLETLEPQTSSFVPGAR